MGLFDGIKIRKAIMHQQKGDLAQARAAYEELYAQGVNLCAYMLPWAVMLLREGGEENYKKAKEVLVKAQKASDLMTGAPAPVETKQLAELGVRTVVPPKPATAPPSPGSTVTRRRPRGIGAPMPWIQRDWSTTPLWDSPT